MSNPNITVTLSSLEVGTVPEVTSIVHVNEGDQLDIIVTWPSSASDNIVCDLNFSASGDQDPFNDIDGGDTSFEMVRASSSEPAVNTLTIKNDAAIASDIYVLTLTIDRQTYTKDPEMDVDPQ